MHLLRPDEYEQQLTLLAEEPIRRRDALRDESKKEIAESEPVLARYNYQRAILFWMLYNSDTK